jgi:hypothetical protein
MPKIRRRDLPHALFQHLLDRVDERSISEEQLGLFATWLGREPTVPEGRWYVLFPEMIVCGEGELVKTFLNTHQIPVGQEVSYHLKPKFQIPPPPPSRFEPEDGPEMTM